jgi:predicted dehydrogenase
MDAHKQHTPPLLFATGFVLRYTPLYEKLCEVLNSGHLGRIVSVDMDEHLLPFHGGYIMCNWRRHTGPSGGHLLEKVNARLNISLFAFFNSIFKIASVAMTLTTSCPCSMICPLASSALDH